MVMIISPSFGKRIIGDHYTETIILNNNLELFPAHVIQKYLIIKRVKMKNIFLILITILLLSCNRNSNTDSTFEQFKYKEDFESQELNAWASYPFWQDTAFDPNIRPWKIEPGDSNISLVQKVTPYSNVDNYAGAQKLLDAYITSGSKIKLRYYLKTQLKPEYLKIRLAAGADGKVDYTISNPVTNKWVDVEATYSDFKKENPNISNEMIKVNAIAVLAKFPKADPEMPIYFGIDDVEFDGIRKVQFSFNEPKMFKLSEWKPFIPQKHYQKDDTFSLKGSWAIGADSISLKVASFTDSEKTVLEKELSKNNKEWKADFKLSFPEGLYLATLEAYKNGKKLSDTQFTIFIEPNSISKNHPRLWFDKKGGERITARLKSKRFQKVKDKILSTAKKIREENPVDSIVYDIDQFPADVSPTFGLSNIVPWFKRITSWRDGVYNNALAYYLLGDKKAGKYAKNLLVKISGFPAWLHPWWIERGQHIYYPIGELGMGLAIGYDLLYDLMNETEREQVRNAFMNQIVKACHKGYVEDNLVTNNTSNWVAHITGGSMMCQAAMYGDDNKIELEPYFTGVVLKAYDMIQKVFTSYGTYGEGYGYFNFSMLSLSKSLPAMDNVFNVDMSAKINGSYKELICAGNVKDKKTYYFGDSGGNLNPLTNFAWLLPKYKDPLLGWFYNYLKKDETFMDVLYETKDVPKQAPFNENPVKFFKEVGTTVFKSGWEKDDFIFVMRTGAFYNHQHLDQGSFWLSDRGNLFIEERHGSTYYLDPYYQSWYTQPVAHSTILINNNHQSQRVGDPRVFAKGFDDHAALYHTLDGSNAAFSSGDIGKLYWGKVKQIRRNVLYLKPRTLLMVDVINPTKEDVDVTLLYQTHYMKDIQAGQSESKIMKDNNVLNIKHLYPEKVQTKVVETPHYIYTLLNEKHLTKEGMLTVTANTTGKPLVMANLLLSTKGEEPEISYEQNNGCISGIVDGRNFIFSTDPNNIYKINEFNTDALALTWDNEKTFAGIVKTLKRNGKLLISSKIPITCEISGNLIKYYHLKKAEAIIGVENKPNSVMLNGEKVTGWEYNNKDGNIKIELPAEEGILIID